MEEESEINITPMMDIVFIMLILAAALSAGVDLFFFANYGT